MLDAGIAREVWACISNVEAGDKLLLSYIICAKYANCTVSHPAYCDKWMTLNFGTTRSDGSVSLTGTQAEHIHCNFFGQSSFSRQSIVSASSIVNVPADTDLQLYAPLCCGLQTGAGAIINSLLDTKGRSQAVQGAGTVGLAAVMAGVLAGAAVIIAIDIQPGRLALVKQLRATHVVDGGDKDVVKQMVALSNANGVNFAVDCFGMPKVVENMVNSLGVKGRGCTIVAPLPVSVA